MIRIPNTNTHGDDDEEDEGSQKSGRIVNDDGMHRAPIEFNMKVHTKKKPGER